MNKKTAGERKRTVTITIGPRTEEVMNDLLTHFARVTGMQEQTLTDLVGASLNCALTAWRKQHLKGGIEVEVNHWD